MQRNHRHRGNKLCALMKCTRVWISYLYVSAMKLEIIMTITTTTWMTRTTLPQYIWCSMKRQHAKHYIYSLKSVWRVFVVIAVVTACSPSGQIKIARTFKMNNDRRMTEREKKRERTAAFNKPGGIPTISDRWIDNDSRQRQSWSKKTMRIGMEHARHILCIICYTYYYYR